MISHGVLCQIGTVHREANKVKKKKGGGGGGGRERALNIYIYILQGTKTIKHLFIYFLTHADTDVHVTEKLL